MSRARVVLVRPSSRWSAAFVAAVRRSRKLHGRWVRPPSTPTAYRAYVRRLRWPIHAAYFICLLALQDLVPTPHWSGFVKGGFR